MRLELRNVVKYHGQLLILDHINLMIDDGELYGIVGSAGAGKSSLVKSILKLLNVDKGDIIYKEDEIVLENKSVKNKIGIVSKEFGLFMKLNVYDNLLYFSSLYYKDKAKIQQTINDVIQLLKLDQFLKVSLNKLSEGQLARVNFACGILHEPQLLILDEPLYRVDMASKEIILSTILKMKERLCTVVFFTEDVTEIEKLCNRISILKRGRIVATGTIEEIKNMVSISEVITVEIYEMNTNILNQISDIISIADIYYDKSNLVIKSKKGTNNLLLILDYLQKNNINFGKVYTQVPNLNDVFLEITGEKI